MAFNPDCGSEEISQFYQAVNNKLTRRLDSETLCLKTRSFFSPVRKVMNQLWEKHFTLTTFLLLIITQTFLCREKNTSCSLTLSAVMEILWNAAWVTSDREKTPGSKVNPPMHQSETSREKTQQLQTEVKN